MNFFLKYFLILLLILMFGCKSNKEISNLEIKDEDIDVLMIEAYEQGLKELEKGYAIVAAGKFNEE